MIDYVLPDFSTIKKGFCKVIWKILDYIPSRDHLSQIWKASSWDWRSAFVVAISPGTSA